MPSSPSATQRVSSIYQGNRHFPGDLEFEPMA
jgi:hypothetical protein